MIDHVVDWFGFDFKLERKDDKTLITLKASLYAMEYWALQYLNSIEIIAPQELRQTIIDNLNKAKEKYERRLKIEKLDTEIQANRTGTT